MPLPLGFSQPKPSIRVVPIGSAVFTLNLGADDTEFIVLEASGTAFSTSQINLPANAALGKVFKFALVTHPVANPSLTTQYVDIFFPITRGTGTNNFWRLYSGQRPTFVFGPNGWVSVEGSGSSNVGAVNQFDLAIGSYANGSSSGAAVGYLANGSTNGTAIGRAANGSNSGAAVGYLANGSSSGAAVGLTSDGSSQGAAVGNNANGSTNGVAIGRVANGSTNGVAIGFNSSTNSKDMAVALGYYGKAERYREMVKSADGAVTTLRQWSMVDWYGDTADATATELLIGGTAAQYCLLLNNSAFMFSMQIIAGVTGGGNTSSYTIMGAIKRGANAAATALVGTPAIVMTGQDVGAATWAVAVTADTTNGSLKLTVTGQAATTIRWNATATLSEVRF